MNNSIQNDLFDAMIQIAGKQLIDKEASSYPKESEIEVTFSASFERRMAKHLREEKTLKLRRTTYRTLRIVAACIGVLAALLVTSFAAFPDFRNLVVNKVIEWTGISADFVFTAQGAYQNTAEPQYIPDGYTITEHGRFGDGLSITYENTAGQQIRYMSSSQEGSLYSIDSEHSTHSIIDLNGTPADLFTTNDPEYPSFLVFQDNSYIFSLNGYLEIEELIYMAKSIF